MKLTNDIRDNVLKGLMEKTFPQEALIQAEHKLGSMWLESSSLAQEQKKMCDDYPKYVSNTDIAYLISESNERLNIHLGFTVAQRKCLSSSYLSEPIIIAKEFKHKSPEFYSAIQSYFELIRAREDFRKNIRKLLTACNSSTQLVKLIPETSVFFSQEQPTALVDKQTLDSINNILDIWRKANGAGKAV